MMEFNVQRLVVPTRFMKALIQPAMEEQRNAIMDLAPASTLH